MVYVRFKVRCYHMDTGHNEVLGRYEWWDDAARALGELLRQDHGSDTMYYCENCYPANPPWEGPTDEDWQWYRERCER